MNEWLFWRTADAADVQARKKHLRPSQPTLNKHTGDAGENATNDRSRGVEGVVVRIGSMTDLFVDADLETKQSSASPIPTHPPRIPRTTE